MGAKDSRPCCISYEEASKRVSEAELKRLQDAFKRASNLNGIITRQAFIKEVLGEFVPFKLAEHIFQACGGTNKGITFKDLLCGLVLLTRGKREEKMKFIFSLCANEAGTHVVKTDMVRLVQSCDGGFVSEAVTNCFTDNDRVTFEEFRDWLLQHNDATSLTRWLLSEPSTVSLSNDLETPTFYQTLAGVTHLEETDIIDLEKRYWILKTQSRTGRLDLDTLIPLISPPVPTLLCEGIFNAFDENRDGHIDFKEMACGISACCRGPLIERQKFCFKVFDHDRDGVLAQHESKQMITSLLFIRKDTRIHQEEYHNWTVSDHKVTEVYNEIMASHDTRKDGTITLEQYLVWSVGQNLPIDFLNLLFQVCHVVFGLKPCSKEEEGEIIRNWLEREERRGMRTGQFWYLISMDWWRSWAEYIDFQLPNSSTSYPSGSLKRNSKMQRKVDGSVAQTLDDGSTNVILSSVITLGEDVASSMSDSLSSSVGSVNSDSAFGPRNSSDVSLQHYQSSSPLLMPKKSSSLQPPEPSRTPNQSPNVVRKNLSIPQRPPSIDNSSLIVPNTLKAMILTAEGGRLRCNTILTRGRDFELVPEAVWRALSNWYGGSPPLPRQVILPRNGDKPELELYPITLRLYRHQANTTRQPGNTWSGVVGSVATAYGSTPASYASHVPVVPKRYLAYLASFSRMASLKQVFDFLCIRLRLRPEDTRLWLYKDDNNLCLLEDEQWTLEQLGVEDNEQILIEVRNKDQTWPEEMSSLINAKLDQRCQGPTEKGATGLNNLGNTCFMNAALQCVSNTKPLTLYFVSNKHLYELNRTNPLGMKGHIAKRYGDLVQDLWSGTSRTIAPLKLRWTIGKYAPRFNGFQQHDSQELLAFLMDGLHEDLNRVHENPYVELKDSDGRPDEEVAREAWENHILRNRSIIVDLFHGQLQSTVKCKVCSHTSVRFDPFNYLSLPLPMESCVHLEVVVVRLDGSVPMKYGLRLNHDDKYITLKLQLGTLCQISSYQLLIAEVAGAVFKSLPSDEQKIRMVVGGCLYAYELSLSSECISDEEVRLHKEPQTLTQIQRMTLTGTALLNKKSNTLPMNGDISRNNGTANNVPDGEGDRSIFNIGDSENDATGYLGVQISANNLSGQQQPNPWIIGGGSSCPSSMSSSLISNSSATDFVDASRRNFVIAYHRKMLRQDVYFLSSQKSRPTLFGLPLILPCHEMTSHQDLYQAVWTQVARLVSPLPPSEASVPNHAQDCDDSLGYEYPFTLKAVQKDGYLCAWCPWYRFCRGCRIDCSDADFNSSATYVAIDWDPTALHLRYQTSQEKVFVDHESVELTRRQQTEPINLHDCLAAFTKEEQLGEDEKYYCSKCKQHQIATKNLQIWRLPPILIVHLKRFQLLNGRWVKSHKIVRFPFKNFDPTDYLAPVPRDAVVSSDKTPIEKTKELVPHTFITSSSDSSSIQQLHNSDSGNTTALTADVFNGGNHLSDGVDFIHDNKNSKNTRHYLDQNILNVTSQNNFESDAPSLSSSSMNYVSYSREGSEDSDKKFFLNGSVVSRHPLRESPEHKNAASSNCSETINEEANQLDFHEHKLKESVDPFRLNYKLYALACHSGILGGGHYVCYACNPNNRWYCYNDSSCREVQMDQIDADSAYMLFYERDGINYNNYMPDVTGKVPDTREIDDEFESDFRKVCSLQ